VLTLSEDGQTVGAHTITLSRHRFRETRQGFSPSFHGTDLDRHVESVEIHALSVTRDALTDSFFG
jgi:hypothetical protein